MLLFLLWYYLVVYPLFWFVFEFPAENNNLNHLKWFVK